jgi:hypothetical protein
MSGESDPSGLDEDELPEGHLDWVALRERMAGKVEGDSYALDKADEASEFWDYAVPRVRGI